MKTINDYAELVKAEHALNKTIAPVEDGANIAGSYTSGKQFSSGFLVRSVIKAALIPARVRLVLRSLMMIPPKNERVGEHMGCL